MTEEEFAEFVAWVETETQDVDLWQIPALIAEVRRLRAALVEIQAIEPDEKPDGTMLGYLAHDADEMAELAREALGVDLPV